MFHAWNKWFYVNFPEKPPLFKDLLTHPGVHNHHFVLELAKSQFLATTFTAIYLPIGETVVVEGTHRACALTMMVHNHNDFRGVVDVYLASWPNEEIPRLGTGWDKE